jgi:hypothetical protein
LSDGKVMLRVCAGGGSERRISSRLPTRIAPPTIDEERSQSYAFHTPRFDFPFSDLIVTDP